MFIFEPAEEGRLFVTVEIRAAAKKKLTHPASALVTADLLTTLVYGGVQKPNHLKLVRDHVVGKEVLGKTPVGLTEVGHHGMHVFRLANALECMPELWTRSSVNHFEQPVIVEVHPPRHDFPVSVRIGLEEMLVEADGSRSRMEVALVLQRRVKRFVHQAAGALELGDHSLEVRKVPT